MNAIQTVDVPGKSRGIPLWSALLALLLLAAVAAVSVGYILYAAKSERLTLVSEFDRLRNQIQRTELEQKKGVEDAKLTTAVAAQSEVRAQALNASNTLGQLLTEADQLAEDVSALKSNEAGRRIALHPDLVAQARRLYESDLRLLASRQDIVSKLQNTRRIDQHIAGDAGTAYQPDSQFIGTLQHAALWGEQELGKVRQMQAVVSALSQEAKIKVSDKSVQPDSPTLETAIGQLARAESAFRQRIITEQTEQAKPQAVEIVVQAAVNKSLEEARLQATNIMASVVELMKEQHRLDTLRQAETTRAFEETRLQITNLMASLKDMQDDQHRKLLVHDAEAKLEDRKAQARAEEQRQEALKLAMRQRAENPALRALLAPFITPAYHQLQGSSFDKVPPSYTQLLSCGALEPTPRGVTKLVNIATYVGDRERPRWQLRGGRLAWGQFQESIDMAKDAQQALSELGPVLVEMGLLSP